MLMGNCDNEKMVFISSSTTNEWPQNHPDDQNNALNMASSAHHVRPTIEKQGQEQLQQQQQNNQGLALKCPRCDSSNTKFCYYNNYNLSQPRHFCKACKRYWTRGGTLRNVPVGGGCRKNKRVKRPSSGNNSDGSGANSSSSSANNNFKNHGSVVHQPQTDLCSYSHMMRPLSYGLHINPSSADMSHVLPFSRFMNSNTSGYDLHDQPHLINVLGLGFSSSAGNINDSTDHNYQNDFSGNTTTTTPKNIQDIVSSNSLFSTYNSTFTASTTTPLSSVAGASPTISSLFSSKFANGGLKDSRGPMNHFQPLTAPFEDLHIENASAANCGGVEDLNLSNKEAVKLEDQGQQRRSDWNQTEKIGLSSSDPSFNWNPMVAVGTSWHDQPNTMSSSVHSLI
ncbi:hypothetical protein F8388_018981 [Cannabis sativa]|uniref:Dof zinc finger protein n=1 Tax=Cannabis sativa TaxID=3483 RepID=A0A7J6H0Q4_CANSA|nr:hypothetical protein F8388_018981 [Cannabis sativa]